MTRAEEYRLRSPQGLSRRRVVYSAALAGAGLALSGAIGCRTEERPSVRPTTPEPKRGGVLRHRNGYETLGAGLDPHIIAAFFNDAYTLFYEKLLGYRPQSFEVEPELAQKWEMPSPTEFVFTLQPNVKWQNKAPANGRALTVEDVLFSMERLRTNEPRFFFRSYFDTVDRIEAIDRASVRFVLKEPDAALLTKLSMDGVAILAPEVVERAAGKFESADRAVGTGPFIMTSLEQGVGAEYVRNPDYWQPSLPHLDGLRTIHFNDDLTAWSAFLAGQLDAVQTVPGTELKKYIAQQGPDFTPNWHITYNYLLAYANVRAKPMDDARVTRALRLLIDHDEQIKTVSEVFSGRGENGFAFPTAARAWDFTHEEYSHFLEWKQPKDEAVRVALDLLRAAGFSRENPLRFEFAGAAYGDSLRAQFQLIQAQWRRLSGGVVDAELKPLDVAEINRVRASRTFTYMYGGEAPGPDPGMALDLQFRTGGSRNFAGFSDPLVDDLIKKQRGMYNAAERKAVIRELIGYVIDHYPGTCPALGFKLSAARPYVRGFVPEQNLLGSQYKRVWLDR